MDHRSSNRRSSNHSTRVLCLTEEEAVALLEICLHSKAEDDALKGRVMEKVGFRFDHDGTYANLPHVIYRLTAAQWRTLPHD